MLLRTSIALTAFVAVSACKTTGSQETEAKLLDGPIGVAPIAQSITVTGPQASKLVKMMIEAGVQNSAIGFGGARFKAKAIDCGAPVVPNPLANCSITTPDDDSLELGQDSANAMHKLLGDIGALYWNGALGASLMKAREVDCSYPVVPNPPVTCKMKVQGQAPQPIDEVETITAPDANDVMKLMKNAGIPSSAQGVGADVRAAEAVFCWAPVVPNPIYSCELTSAGLTYELTGFEAKHMFERLSAAGAGWSDGSVGANKVKANDLRCSAPVVPNPQATCTFKKAL